MGKMFSQIIASFTSFLKTSKLVTREAALTEGGVSENQVDVNNVTQEGLEGLSEEEIVSIAKSLKGKLDVRLMAMAWVMFAFNHFDRVRTLQATFSLDADTDRLLELSGLSQDHGPPG